jgi:hypothetical protein
MLALNPLMDEERQSKVSDIKEQVRRGSYTVDPRAVADAILRRLHGLAEPSPGTGAQQEGASPS